MSRAAIEQLLYMMDEAFDPAEVRPDSSQSLLPNLDQVDDETWRTAPLGASRSIHDIVMHVGSCKYMYDNHAFGDGALRWDSKLVNPWPDSQPHMSEVIDWMRGGHRRVRHHVQALEDDGLGVERMAPWGTRHPTLWLMNVLVQHDLYHAGEINHIRSLLAGDDRWAHERELATS